MLVKNILEIISITWFMFDVAAILAFCLAPKYIKSNFL